MRYFGVVNLAATTGTFLGKYAKLSTTLTDGSNSHSTATEYRERFIDFGLTDIQNSSGAGLESASKAGYSFESLAIRVDLDGRARLYYG